MKFLNAYKEKLGCENEEAVFQYLTDNLQASISDWAYFVDWKKVKKNVASVETELNILNTLIGKDDIDKRFIQLISEYPKTKTALPLLIAVRKKKLREVSILNGRDSLRVENKDYVFDIATELNNQTERELLRFFNESGLKSVFEDKSVKNLVDYCMGVEVGMDTNARKNRGGDNMEQLVEAFVNEICRQKGYEYIRQGDAAKIKQRFGYDVPVDKSSRRYDFVVNAGNAPVLIETNFYGGGGSKLKSTAGEYRNLFDVLNSRFKFIWITDGVGWKKSVRPLRETFDHNDYLLTLKMVEAGVLNAILR